MMRLTVPGDRLSVATGNPQPTVVKGFFDGFLPCSASIALRHSDYESTIVRRNCQIHYRVSGVCDCSKDCKATQFSGLIRNIPVFEVIGTPGRTRTYNLLIKSQMLYQLSYGGR